MTKVEKETLLALHRLGRRNWHSVHEVTATRLRRRHRGRRIWTSKSQRLYDNATSWKIYVLMTKGLVETKHIRMKAGNNLNIAYGPLFRITKEGQKLARKLK